jgi:competence protein ComEC
MDDLTIYSGEGGFVISRVNKLRRYIVDTLFSNMDYKEAATLTALTVGDRSYLSDEFYANLKAAGVSHLMVVSGLHLAIIVSLVNKLIEKVIYNRYLKAITVLLTVLFMAALCGFTKSIIRAGLCYIIYAMSIVLKRDNIPENTLGAAVTLILIAEPFAILSISFQLSVLSTLGITAAALPVTKYLKDNVFKNSWLTYFVNLAIVTLSALLFTLPVTVWVFGYVSVVAVIANILVAFAVTLALNFAAIGLVFYYIFPLGGQILLVSASLVTKYANFIINILGSLPFAAVRLYEYSFIFALLLLFSVIFILFACKHRRDMLKLKIMHEKIISEGGGKLKWQ